jgi:hypothetical protein
MSGQYQFPLVAETNSSNVPVVTNPLTKELPYIKALSIALKYPPTLIAQSTTNEYGTSSHAIASGFKLV